ncbi:hypothetical protein HPB50_005686 [Hyalomma asiaticum]|uniref:Uncharacterized protein n=1 Tax=Hyalomma asiaticum TaxID=266040 RepID=A0ACB7S0J4_HYAAI|nr:hypothetical protein HPB50_005686 [Hyalomma asiaticum]
MIAVFHTTEDYSEAQRRRNDRESISTARRRGRTTSMVRRKKKPASPKPLSPIKTITTNLVKTVLRFFHRQSSYTTSPAGRRRRMPHDAVVASVEKRFARDNTDAQTSIRAETAQYSPLTKSGDGVRRHQLADCGATLSPPRHSGAGGSSRGIEIDAVAAGRAVHVSADDVSRSRVEEELYCDYTARLNEPP